MAYELPEALKQLKPYDPVTEIYPVRLDANESFLSLPSSIREEISEAIRALPFNRYPDPFGTKLCRKAGEFFKVGPETITIGNGSDELIGLILANFVSPGDTMAVALPDFSMYAFYAGLNGVKVADVGEICGTKGDLSLSARMLIQGVEKSKARLLVFSNPCNPTSLKLSEKEVEEVIEALPEVLIVVDEAYMDFTDGSILQKAPGWDHVIVLKTCSKAFGMAGIRLGFAIAGPEITKALQAVKSPYNVNSMTQEAGYILFSHPQYLMDCMEDIKASREELYEGLMALAREKEELLTVFPTETNFVLIQVKKPEEIYKGLLKKGISIRYMKQYLRISAGSRTENEEVLAALSELLQ